MCIGRHDREQAHANEIAQQTEHAEVAAPRAALTHERAFLHQKMVRRGGSIKFELRKEAEPPPASAPCEERGRVNEWEDEMIDLVSQL